MMPPVVLISIPLITNDTDHLLICLLVQESISVLKFPLRVSIVCSVVVHFW